jgi:hypothetical protein
MGRYILLSGRIEMTLILDAPHVSQKYKPNAKKKAGEAYRIEMLGRLDDRHKQALVAGDKGALLELAADYAMLNMPNTASQITFEAENL